MGLVSNMVSFLHRNGRGPFAVAPADGSPFLLAGEPANLVVDQGHTANAAGGTALILVGFGGSIALWLERRVRKKVSLSLSLSPANNTTLTKNAQPVGPILSLLPHLGRFRPAQLPPHHGRPHLHLRRDGQDGRSSHRPRRRSREPPACQIPRRQVDARELVCRRAGLATGERQSAEGYQRQFNYYAGVALEPGLAFYPGIYTAEPGGAGGAEDAAEGFAAGVNGRGAGWAVQAAQRVRGGIVLGCRAFRAQLLVDSFQDIKTAISDG